MGTMKLGDLLQEQDLQELGPMSANPGVQTQPGMAQPAVSQQFDPKLQTAMAAKAQQDKIKQRKAIQDQIAAVTKQLADLRKQLADIQ